MLKHCAKTARGSKVLINYSRTASLRNISADTLDHEKADGTDAMRNERQNATEDGDDICQKLS